MSKATATGAIGFDLGEGDGVICCFCYLGVLNESPAPDLLLLTTAPSGPISGDERCPRCHLPYGRGQAEEAAKTIREKWLS